MPKGTPVHGLAIEPNTGKLNLLSDGNVYLAEQGITMFKSTEE